MHWSRKYLIAITAVFCCGVMALTDGIIRPCYAIKSLIKIVIFLIVPLLLCRKIPTHLGIQLLRPRKSSLIVAASLGILIFLVILFGFLLISPYIDFSNIADSLTSNAGVTRENYLFVSLYISLVNSFLEEFFFRGYVFTNLKTDTNRRVAYIFSAALFSLYHVAIMIGWFSLPVFLLVMIGLFIGGLIFNWLNEKMDTIFCSWLTHMFANFAINTVGYLLLNK